MISIELYVTLGIAAVLLAVYGLSSNYNASYLTSTYSATDTLSGTAQLLGLRIKYIRTLA
jgi:hypothetical protein